MGGEGDGDSMASEKGRLGRRDAGSPDATRVPMKPFRE
mgnify:CR=1 FL=1